MTTMDECLEALKSPVYQKMMKKNRKIKQKRKSKEILKFIGINILIPILVSVIATFIILGLEL